MWSQGFHRLLETDSSRHLRTKMAEVKKMKGKRTTAQQKLTVALTHLENIIAEDNGRVPTEMALVRQQTGLQNAP